MVFNSLQFFLFFLVFFAVYWFAGVKNNRIQNIILLTGSYIFYSFASWQFVVLLVIISAINYLLGIGLEDKRQYSRLFLWLGMLVSVGSLVYFKYFNFFIDSFNHLFTFLHVNVSLPLANIIIPLGISFFTFKNISYLLDINKQKIHATRDVVVFFNYVAFFPTILSGPIDKAKTFIPQLNKDRRFDYNLASDGMRQILWGLFKKMVVADNCALLTNSVFSNYQQMNGSALLIGAFIYTMQIYADFSGYSDMAIGIAKLLGFSVTKNFEYPYFSQNIAEFWRRWHISLTNWLTEYVFTPLSIAFRDLNNLGLALAIIINFTICGIWHGANWTYILYGFLHGCYFIPLIISGNVNKKSKIRGDKLLPSFRESYKMLGTFILVMLTFVLFRADSITHATTYYQRLFSLSLFMKPVLNSPRSTSAILFFIAIMLITEWMQRNKEHGLQIEHIKKTYLRIGIYYALIILVLMMQTGETNQFIYFKF